MYHFGRDVSRWDVSLTLVLFFPLIKESGCIGLCCLASELFCLRGSLMTENSGEKEEMELLLFMVGL